MNAVNRWRNYNPNPAGRSVGDCAVRAISAALGVDWETAYMMIAEAGFQMADMPSSNSVWGAVLRQNGFRRYAVPNTCPECYTLEQFAEDHPEGVYVVGTGNHVVTIRDGWVMDSWNSLMEIPQFYWKKG
ncbi:MAG: hypothetical protein J6Y48_10395 [Clostridia bacterium]|nr:hypothetical protein [Clostridia bacterium]